MTLAQLSAAKHAVKEYAAACGEVGGGTEREVSHHPWAGVSCEDLSQADIDDLVAAGRAWGEALRNAVATAELVEDAARAGLPVSLSAFERIEKTLLATEPDPVLLRSGYPAAVCGAGTEAKVLDAVAAIATAVDAWSGVGRRWATHRRASDAHWLKIEKVVERAQTTFGGGATRTGVRKAAERAHGLLQGIGGTAAAASEAACSLGIKSEMTAVLAARLAGLATSSLSLSADVFAIRTDALGDADCEPHLEDLTRRGADLVGKRSKLASAFPAATRPPIQRVREMIAGIVDAPRFLPSVFSGKYRRAVADFRIATGRRPPRAEMEAELRALAALHDEAESFAADPWLQRLFGTFSAGMDSPFLDARTVRQWRITLERAASSLGSAGSALVDAGWTGDRSVWRSAAKRFSELIGVAPEAALAEVEALESDLGSAPGTLAGATLGTLEGKLREVCEVAAALEGVFSEGGFEEDAGIGAVAVALRAVGEARRRNRMAEPHEGFIRGLGVEPDDTTTLAELRAAAKYVQALRSSSLSRGLVAWLCIDDVASRRATIIDQVVRAVSAIRAALELGLRFQGAGAIDWASWTATTSTPTADLVLADVRALADRIERALSDKESLYSLARFLRARRYARAASAEQVCALVEDGVLGSDQAADAFEAMALGTIANGVLRNDPDLDRFAGAAHEKIRERFAAFDALMEKEFVEHLRYDLLRAPAVPGVGTGPVDDLTDEGLLRHYANHPRGRITIRKVFERASDAVLALKPCFMMSPQAIAQYLAPGVFDFDLVVMDEASQIKPEDAMGAVARGRQLVVVGDPKQLGPTTFFERQAFDTDEDEPEVGPGVSTPPAGPTEVDRSESILVASAARFPTRMLRWHYRSAHPKLIAFSNTKFYDGQLIVFPTPRDRVAMDGVFFTRVQDAVYSGQKNETEAAAVVEAVRRHARERPDRSLLVATLNFKQADLVDELLDRAEKEDENLEAFRKRWAETLEPLDVKNLENVQGDERDAIIVSLTYGYDELNRFHRRFGPINMVGGERRLNVLFTRAKHRVDVFCSFAPQDIGAGPTSPVGVKILQDYLRYASDGDWVTGDPCAREPDSEFEVAVAATLSRLGMQVHTQVGVHGYFIDLAVVDPRAPGTYLLGIECDGATYHSGRTARDRDRLRQKTLERFGWNIHRVWSTDWFRDPTREAGRVAAKVRKLMEG